MGEIVNPVQQRRQAVETITNALAALSKADLESIWTEAKEEAEKKDLYRHGCIFDKQLEELKKCGVPRPVLDFLRAQRFSVITRAVEMKLAAANIPFAPVLPAPYMALYSQVDLVIKECGGNAESRIDLKVDLTSVMDCINTPNQPYYIFGVDNYACTCRQTADNYGIPVVGEACHNGCSCLTLAEVFALRFHGNSFFSSRDAFLAANSRCRQIGTAETELVMPWFNVDGHYGKIDGSKVNTIINGGFLPTCKQRGL